MKCPNCKLENPASALRCDCGYDFAEKQIKESYLKEKKPVKSKSRLEMIVTILMIIIALYTMRWLRLGHLEAAFLGGFIGTVGFIIIKVVRHYYGKEK